MENIILRVTHYARVARLNGTARFHLALGEKFDGASINFRESVSMVPLSTFGKTFVKFA